MTAPLRDQGVRQLDYAVLSEVLLLGGTATLLLVKWLRGQLDFYIHPRYTALSILSGLSWPRSGSSLSSARGRRADRPG